MMQRAHKPFTLREYPAREEVAGPKSALFRGEIFVVAGDAPNHDAIAVNVASKLRQEFVKFELYRDLPPLQHHGMRVECHRRQNDGWLFSSCTHSDDVIIIRPETGWLEAGPIALRVRDLYDKVEFEA